MLSRIPDKLLVLLNSGFPCFTLDKLVSQMHPVSIDCSIRRVCEWYKEKVTMQVPIRTH